jgi:hypothetical protein
MLLMGKLYKHTTGEISPVRLMIAVMGTKRIRLANLPPEPPNTTIRNALSQYGDVQSIQDETWPKHYCYTVSNGVRIVMMTLKKHILSLITVAGYRALTSYDGQPQTCYGCDDTEHMYHVCPKRRGAKIMAPAPVDHTWANIVASSTTSLDVRCTSDAATMDTDPGSRAVGQMSSVTSEGQGEPVPATIDGLQPARYAPPGHTTTPSNQDSSTPTHLKWADEDTELENTSSLGAKPSEDVLAATREWPPLLSPTVGFHDVHNSQPRPILSAVDTDETPVHTDTSNDCCTEHVPADLFRTSTTRKKLQMDKIGETSQDRKRNRTLTPVSTKEKYLVVTLFLHPSFHPTWTHYA